jgi:hypothetical protein
MIQFFKGVINSGEITFCHFLLTFQYSDLLKNPLDFFYLFNKNEFNSVFGINDLQKFVPVSIFHSLSYYFRNCYLIFRR